MEQRYRAIADRDVGSRESYFKMKACMLMRMIRKERKKCVLQEH